MADMRERLINILKKAKNRCLIYSGGNCLACKLRGNADCTIENIAEHLLANGVVALPCNVGDTVYGFHLKNVLPYSVKWLETDDRGEWRVVAQYPPMAPRFYKLEDFGKTVFLTKEEAEQALKERGADG